MVPIQFNVKGPDLMKLQTYTRVIFERFSKVPGVADLDTDYETGKPEARVHIDREKASDLGVAVAPIASTIRTLIGGEPVAKFRGEGAEVRAPMAVTVIGGLLTSMFLTLVVIPVVYTLFDDLILRLKAQWGGIRTSRG